MESVLGLDELGCDPQLINVLADTSLQDMGDAEAAADLPQVLILVPEHEGGSPPDDLGIGMPGNEVQNLLTDSVRKILLILFRAEVKEWKYGDGALIVFRP